MKEWIKYFFVFVIVIFVLPVVFTRTNTLAETIENNKDMDIKSEDVENAGNDEENNEVNNSENSSIEKYDYGEYSTIKLYHKENANIEEIPFDEYLYGTVSAEMPANYELEALKAQAIVSRTYTLYQIKNNAGKHEKADICDDATCCQAWISKEDRLAKWSEDERQSNWNKIVEAVNSTSGMVITYEGKLINAFFHSNSGGITETASNVWGGSDLPYLQSVETSGETEYSQYNSEVILTKSELLNLIKGKYPDIQIDWNSKDENGILNAIKILEYTESRKG